MVPICSEWWLLYGFSFQPFSYSGCQSHHYFMLQLTLIMFFLTFTVCFIPFVFFQKKTQRLLSLLFLTLPSLTLFTWWSFFCHSKQNLVFLSFTPFWFRVPFLISCKDFVSYLCSILEGLIAHYFFQTSFCLMPSSILCLVMWIFNEEQFVPHCLLSITCQKYDDSNYL